jgi:hypothetical protein
LKVKKKSSLRGWGCESRIKLSKISVYLYVRKTEVPERTNSLVIGTAANSVTL